MRAEWAEPGRWSHLVWDNHDPSSPQTSMIVVGNHKKIEKKREIEKKKNALFVTLWDENEKFS
jgi:hypothetical protein